MHAGLRQAVGWRRESSCGVGASTNRSMSAIASPLFPCAFELVSPRLPPLNGVPVNRVMIEPPFQTPKIVLRAWLPNLSGNP